MFYGNLETPGKYFDPDDFYIIDQMSRLDADELFFVDLPDLEPDLTIKKALNLRTNDYQEMSMDHLEAIIFLEASNVKKGIYQKPKIDEVMRRLAAVPDLFTLNSVGSFFELQDKSYICSHPEINFPQSYLVDNAEEAIRRWRELGRDAVIKPLVGFGGEGVVRITPNQDKFGDKLWEELFREHGPKIIQEYLPQVRAGENSLFFFDRSYKYAIKKTPKEGDFRSNLRFCKKISPYSPPHSEIDAALGAITCLNSSAMIIRVDLVGNKIMEITAECPGFYVEEAEVQGQIGKYFYEILNRYCPA